MKGALSRSRYSLRLAYLRSRQARGEANARVWKVFTVDSVFDSDSNRYELADDTRLAYSSSFSA